MTPSTGLVFASMTGPALPSAPALGRVFAGIPLDSGGPAPRFLQRDSYAFRDRRPSIFRHCRRSLFLRNPLEHFLAVHGDGLRCRYPKAYLIAIDLEHNNRHFLSDP